MTTTKKKPAPVVAEPQAPGLVTVYTDRDHTVYPLPGGIAFEGGKAEMAEAIAEVLVNDRNNQGRYRLTP